MLAGENMTDYIAYQFSRIIYIIVLILPLGFLGMAAERICATPPWVRFPVAIITLIYLIYAFAWATRAAKLIAFQGRPFLSALKESRTQLNVDIRVWAEFVPIIGFLFKQRKNDTTPTFDEWDAKRNQNRK